MLMGMFATAVSIAAILLSAVTFSFSYRASRAAERRARIPVLVFVYEGDRGWLLRNVGNGPALNIEVAQKVVRGEQAGSWINPVRVPPLGRDKEILLSWLRDDNLHGRGAIYEDFLSADQGATGRTFTVTCGNDRKAVVPGRHLPKWSESEIVAQWRRWLPGHQHARYRGSWHTKIKDGGRDQLAALFAESGLRPRKAARGHDARAAMRHQPGRRNR